MVAIKYRNPRRPGESGLMLAAKQAEAEAAKARLARQGFVLVDDDTAARLQGAGAVPCPP